MPRLCSLHTPIVQVSHPHDVVELRTQVHTSPVPEFATELVGQFLVLGTSLFEFVACFQMTRDENHRLPIKGSRSSRHEKGGDAARRNKRKR